MSFVLAQQQRWSQPLTPVPLGPFAALRDGVNDPACADFFMWEEFTTKPFFEPQPARQAEPPLKKIGEISSPWPSWLIVASTSTFPSPDTDPRLAQLFDLLDCGIADFVAAPAPDAARMLASGELGCRYAEHDALAWLRAVRFTPATRGVDPALVDGVVGVLKQAGVVDQAYSNADAVARVVGVRR